MAGSSNQFVYQLGQTLIPVGLSATVQVIPPRGCNGIYFGWQSGGSLALSNQSGLSMGQCYLLGTTERINVDGPATFFLVAAGTTSMAGVVFKYSSGYSILP